MSFQNFSFPQPLKVKSKIGVTGPSGGVSPRFHKRLDLVIQHLTSRGFEVIEGECLRDEIKHVSAEKVKRAKELQDFLLRKDLDAIFPPWGGSLLIEILPLLDFELIRKAKPIWISSYSDISTLQFALTTITGIATAHTPNLMDLAPRREDSNDILTLRAFDVLSTLPGNTVVQNSSSHYIDSAFLDYEDVGEVFMPSIPTRWRSLKREQKSMFEGRLIGGCLDTISCLTGTPFGNLENFKRVAGKDGVIFYFENCNGSPAAVVRMIHNIVLAGWFEGVNGIMIGRSSGLDGASENELKYVEALHSSLDQFKIPIIYDVDIGHRPPQMSLVNGAKAKVFYEDGKGQVVQTIS